MMAPIFGGGSPLATNDGICVHFGGVFSIFFSLGAVKSDYENFLSLYSSLIISGGVYARG